MFTTASMPVRANFAGNRVLHILAAVYGMVWLATAYAPFNRFDWFLENLLVFAFIGMLVATYRVFPLSDLSYLLMTVFLSLHAVGAHYTYSEAPLGAWFQEAWNLERNHYDRLVHFIFGLLFCYPLREVILRGTGASRLWGTVLSLVSVLALSNVYEILEWAIAEIVDPQAAFAFLGTQGDIFDAQKDSALAAVGAVLGLAITAVLSQGRGGSRPAPPQA